MTIDRGGDDHARPRGQEAKAVIPMPQNQILKSLALLVQDIALFCGAVKPALLAITDFVLFFVGLAAIVGILVRSH